MVLRQYAAKFLNNLQLETVFRDCNWAGGQGVHCRREQHQDGRRVWDDQHVGRASAPQGNLETLALCRNYSHL